MLGMHKIHSSPYHPQGNGLIENWHRSLKAGLESHNASCTEALPVVLLGLRTAVRGEASAAEMALGTTLRIPGALLEHRVIEGLTDSFVINLKEKMNNVVPRPTSNHDTRYQVHVPKDLSSCSHVFLRTDRVRKALEAPFTGPHEVIRRNEKNVVIKTKKGEQAVSVDRVKPAYHITEDDNNTMDKVTAGGHHVRYRIQGGGNTAVPLVVPPAAPAGNLVR